MKTEIKLKNKLINKVQWRLVNLKNKKYKLPSKTIGEKVAYVLGVSNHPNAGDQEITLAQKRFIEKYCSEFRYVEIEKEKIPYIISDLKNNIDSDDIIFYQGGGTLSNLYPEHEIPRKLVLSSLKDAPCKIIQFPVSFHYDDINEFRENSKLYNDVKNLVVFVREAKSFEILKNELKVPVYHVPDIVLSQQKNNYNTRENKVLVMFRSDKECSLSPQLANQIIESFSKRSKVIITDNYVKNYTLTFDKNRERLLSEKFDEFSKAKLVITDRLHGMIFAYVTGTPAIVFDNSYGKVKYSYLSWLKEAGHIHFLEGENLSLDKVLESANALLDSENNFSLNIEEAFHPLIDIVKN
ncbi:polysaccharide pyruvyl transferase family protein [Pluralibacter gergoviae]|nr:polysaccharide pyruvyl transferase family protein [Pluralibacter gergoviae]ELC3016775.1 polysaccharide pyruvyl transferase family protein [Pluralibacter gergoviae]ELC3022294.1 polysaccharide pyruvyl transferase family protein [Pluralibacter gergoviae]